MNLSITVESWGREVVLSVEVDVDPGEPGYNEIVKILRDGEDITDTLSEREFEELQELVDEAVQDEIAAAEEDAAVSAYEDRMDRMEREAESGRWDP